MHSDVHVVVKHGVLYHVRKTSAARFYVPSSGDEVSSRGRRWSRRSRLDVETESRGSGCGPGTLPLAIVTCVVDGGFGSSQPGSCPGATLSLWNVSRTVSALNFASTPPKAISLPLSSRYFLLFGKGPVRRSTWERMVAIGGMVRNVRRIVQDGDKNAEVKEAARDAERG